ncbi:MAG: hypothetical protein ABJK28_01830 [Algibacter sp.]
MKRSTEGFIQFEHVLGINPDLFRIFTGMSELIIASLLIIISIKQFKKLSIITYFIVLSTMITALSLEFFVRFQPKIILVIIAILLIIFSSYSLKQLKNN